ncbi:MAG: AI-2E family transporter [bacterium]
MLTHEKIQIAFFGLLVFIVGFFGYMVFRPFLTVACFSVFLAVALYPIYLWVLRFNKERKFSSSIITVIIALVVVIIPAVLFAIVLLQQAGNAYTGLLDSVNSGTMATSIGLMETKIQAFIPGFQMNIAGYLSGGLSWAVGNLDKIVSGFSNVIMYVVLTTFFLFYLFVYGESLVNKLVGWSPMEDSLDKKIIAQIKLSINSVIRGYLLVATLQGIVAGIGMAIFGFNNAIIGGTLTGIASFVPFFGTGLVMAPVAIYMAVTGHLGAGIGIAIWGFTMVHLIDNFLMPYLLNRGMKLNQFLSLLAVLGGLSAFGPIGLVVGPLVLSLIIIMIDIYPLIIKKNV